MASGWGSSNNTAACGITAVWAGNSAPKTPAANNEGPKSDTRSQVAFVLVGHASAMHALRRIATALNDRPDANVTVYANGDVTCLAEEAEVRLQKVRFLLLVLSDVSFNDTLPGFHQERSIIAAAMRAGIPIGIYYGERFASSAPYFSKCQPCLNIFLDPKQEPFSIPVIGQSGNMAIQNLRDGGVQVIANAMIATALGTDGPW